MRLYFSKILREEIEQEGVHLRLEFYALLHIKHNLCLIVCMVIDWDQSGTKNASSFRTNNEDITVDV